MLEPYDYAYENELTDNPYYRRDLADREDSEGRGLAEHGEPAVFYLVKPLSSGASASAKTTFKCSILQVINEEIEGADMVLDDTGGILYATNVGLNRPTIGEPYPCFKIGERFVIVA